MTRHNSALDGVRGIAIFLVLLSHGVGLLNHAPPWLTSVVRLFGLGWCGVDLFFVLSGFLITGILIKTKPAVNRVVSFYMRRFLRIFPIYYVVLLIFFAAGTAPLWLLGVLPFNDKIDHLGFLLFLQNWLPLRHGGQFPPNIIGHFWSLAVEEQFYLVWPWIVWAVSKRALPWVCVIGAIGALLLRIGLINHFGPQIWIFIATPCRGEGLLIGSALAALVAVKTRISPYLLGGMALAGAALIVPILVRTDVPFRYILLFGVSGFALFFGALVGSCECNVPLLTSLLTIKPLRNLGKYSYGIYVYHVPVFGLTSHYVFEKFTATNRFRYELQELAALIVVSYGVAWLSYTYFEEPILRLKRRFEPVFNQPLVSNAAPVPETTPTL